MPTMLLRDVPAGTICFTRETIGDDRNNLEVRETFYRRIGGLEKTRYPRNVMIARLGIAQGDPNQGPAVPPRYRVALSPPCCDPGEADGLTQVHRLFDGLSRWEEWIV